MRDRDGRVVFEKTTAPGVYKYTSEKKKFRREPDVCYYIMFRDSTGKVIKEKAGWLSQGMTVNKAALLKAERAVAVNHGDELPRDKKEIPALREVAEKYLEWAKNNKARGGIDDKSRYENHLQGRFGERKMNEITPLDMERMKAELSEKYAAATVAHVLKLMRMIYNKAKTWKLYAGESPIQGVKLPIPRNARERFLNHEEANALLEALKKKSGTVHDYAAVSLYTGMRAGEVFNLRGYDVDLKNALITVTDSKNNSRRTVYMTGTVKRILRARMPKDPSEYIFTDRRHGVKITEVSETFRVVADSLFNQGTEDARQRVTFHTLRHTHASWLALQGESLLVIKEALGHKDLKMTQRYSHLSDQARRKAADKLEKQFEKVKGEIMTRTDTKGITQPDHQDQDLRPTDYMTPDECKEGCGPGEGNTCTKNGKDVAQVTREECQEMRMKMKEEPEPTETPSPFPGPG